MPAKANTSGGVPSGSGGGTGGVAWTYMSCSGVKDHHGDSMRPHLPFNATLASVTVPRLMALVHLPSPRQGPSPTLASSACRARLYRAVGSPPAEIWCDQPLGCTLPVTSCKTRCTSSAAASPRMPTVRLVSYATGLWVDA